MGKRSVETRPSQHNEGAKRRNVGASTGTPTELPQVKSAPQLQQLLGFKQNSGDGLKHGIQTFKAFLDSIVYSEESPARSKCLNILRTFFEAQKPQDPEEQEDVYLQDLFRTWSYAAQSNNESLLSAVPAVLALLLKTISSLIDFREYGTRLCKTLLRLDQLKLIASGLTSNKAKEHIISPCVRLLTEVVSYDGGVVARRLYTQRDFTFKRLDILLGIRRVSLEGSLQDRSKPSIRYNAVRYLLANLKFQDQAAKSDILSQGRIIRALFKDIKEDSPDVVRETLNVVKKHVVLDDSLPKNIKSRLLTDTILGRIATLYNYELDSEELDGGQQSVGQKSVDTAAHEFLLYVCTSPNLGVLHTQSGWYPPSTDTEAVEYADTEASDLIDLGLDSLGSFDKYQERVPVRNPALSSFLQSLRPYANSMQSKLVLAIFKAAPELVADYFLKKRSFTLDPKLTSTWLGYSAFVFSTVQLPIPKNFGRQDGYASRPPPTMVVIESILPQPLTQKTLRRCLNQNEQLITFFAVRLLTVALEKLEQVVQMFQTLGGHAGIWDQATSRLVAEFCRRSPAMKDVIRIFRNSNESDVQHREALAKLMVVYYRVVPQIALEEKFDISLALVNSLSRIDKHTEAPEDSELRLHELGHLLQIAHQSPDMRWWHRPESLNLSPFTTVLKLVVKNPPGTPLKQIKTLLRSILRRSAVLLGQDSSSLEVLIASLQDIEPQDSSASVFDFLDECILRFVQKSVKYHEEMTIMSSTSSAADNSSLTTLPSPLFATLVEQWPFVVKSGKQAETVGIARWLARYLGYTNQIIGDKALLATVRDKLVSDARSPDCRAALQKAFHKKRKHGSPQKQQSSDELSRPDNVKDSSQMTGSSAELSEMLQGPETEDEDHPGLHRWMRKDVQEAIDEGDIGELVICVCSQHEEIRKQSLVNIENFMVKLEASTYVEWEQIFVLLGSFVETIREIVPARAVPFSVGIFTSRALLVLTNPLHFLYGKINRFLNKGPPWSTARLPSYWMERVLLHQPEDDDAHEKEVEWVLETMSDGLRTTEDMEIYRRCGAFERFLSFYSSPHISQALRKKIIRLIFRATYVGGSTTLLTRAGILSWIQDQVALKDPHTGILKLLLERLCKTCDHERIADWSGGTIADTVDRLKTATSPVKGPTEVGGPIEVV